jgi:hypothetical protein
MHEPAGVAPIHDDCGRGERSAKIEPLDGFDSSGEVRFD